MAADWKYDPKIDLAKQRNADVFRETMAVCKAGEYTLPDGRVVQLPRIEDVLSASRWYENPPNVIEVAKASESAVDVVEGDCIDVTRELKDRGFNPVMLNMASRRGPGGGVLSGARAQEETLFRRSNLCLSLYQYESSGAALVGIPRASESYPINRDTGGIYSGHIMFFRKGVAADYSFEEFPYECGVVSVPAINNPALDENGRLVDWAIRATQEKIRVMLRIGLRHGHDAIVLGAWGCGAFHNPPDHMAELFRDVMAEPEFAGKYRCMRFAIIEDHNSRNRNLAAFRKVFA